MGAGPPSPSTTRTPLGETPRFEGGAQEVATATWAWIQPNGGLGESNAGLVVGDGESLLIDTLWDERLTRRMLAGLADAREGAPIRTLVNTHGDGDHWYGNRLCRGAEIIATERAAEQMEEEPPSMLTRLAPVRRVAGAVGGTPLVPGRAKFRGIADFGRALSRYDFAGSDPIAPTRRFEGELEIEVGGRAARMIEVGPAHTPGDAFVWVPDQRVVYSGDIVFSGVTPIMWAGPVGNWIEALDRIAELEPAVVVPGHGPVCDLERVRELREYWVWLERHVPPGAQDGVERLSEDLIRSIEYRTSPWGEWSLPERTLINVARIAAERDDEDGPLGVPARISLLAAMGALRERLAA